MERIMAATALADCATAGRRPHFLFSDDAVLRRKRRSYGNPWIVSESFWPDEYHAIRSRDLPRWHVVRLAGSQCVFGHRLDRRIITRNSVAAGHGGQSVNRFRRTAAMAGWGIAYALRSHLCGAAYAGLC